jgi:hypothetical protein
MVTCKMTYVIQGILLSHYFHSVDLSNYGLPHVPRGVVHLSAFHLPNAFLIDEQPHLCFLLYKNSRIKCWPYSL